MVKINEDIRLEDFYAVLFEGKSIAFSDAHIQRVANSFSFLKDFAKDKVIYGVNTGFGPMAQYRIDEQDQESLQYNLIRSHASGMGKALSPIYVKSLMLARLNTLALGKSGVHQEVIQLMTQLINHNVTPLIFEHGGVGASGDLVQLAHLALVLIGEGEVFYQGKRSSTAAVFKKLQLQPIKIHAREGLALMNGTSVMTGIGIVNVLQTQRLVNWSVFASSLLNELVAAYDDHFSAALNNAKQHQGQQEIAQRMRAHLQDSKRIKKREQHWKKPSDERFFKEKVQEYYSLRCVPQVLGPVWDTLQQSTKVLMDEVNSANDNPIIDADEQHIYHGGNFHGDYVSLEMDKLKLVVTKLSMLSERQLNYLLNDKLNDFVKPFINMGTLGLNFGMQGMQFSAVSTTAENQALSTSMYVHSIPNNNDNQDIVSMGTNAANMTKTVIENAFEVLSVELIALTQAVYALGVEEELSSASKKGLTSLMAIIPPFTSDKPGYSYQQKIKEFIQQTPAY